MNVFLIIEMCGVYCLWTETKLDCFRLIRLQSMISNTTRDGVVTESTRRFEISWWQYNNITAPPSYI
jgi:hypothetical protein